MKKTLLLFAMLIGGMSLFAQIPEGWDPFSVDTLDVPPIHRDPETNEFKISLAHYLNKDTSATGQRNPDRVYRLERYKDEVNAGIYMLDYGMNISFPLRMVAEEGSGRFPMIAPEYNSTGSVLGYLFKLIGDNQHHSFENIFFQRVNLDRQFDADWLSGLEFEGNNSRVEIDGCVFNAFTKGGALFTGNDNSIFIQNCVFRNGEWPSHPFIGNASSFGENNHIDTLVYTNNIYFNNNSSALLHGGEVIDYLVIEHNTFMTSIINAFQMPLMVNAKVRSNLFYGYAAYGDTRLARTSGAWYEADGDSLSVISLNALGRLAGKWSHGGEYDRDIQLTNNVYYTPQALKDHYTKFATWINPKDEQIDPVTAPLWMNERTQNMFNDDAAYPNLVANNNVEADPQFANNAMDTWVVGAVVKFCEDNRNSADTDGWGTSVHRNYDAYLGDDILSGIQWPLPEGLMEITNTQLLTAGHDGEPVGSLMWKNIYTGIDEGDEGGASSTPDFNLYPNPVNNVLNIAFGEDAQQVEIYNLLGKLEFSQSVIGFANTQIDVSTMPKGVYIVRVITASGNGSTKFIKQ